MSKLSVLIAVYNEDAYIQRCLEKIANEKLKNWDKEIIVVNDGSTDNTLKLLQKFDQEVHPLRIINLAQNQGKGFAIKKAAAAATGDVLLIQDGDLEYDPHDYQAILQKYQNKKIEVVYGSRVLGEKYYPNQTSNILFYLGGRTLSFLMNTLFKTQLTDQPTCYKSWRSKWTQDLINDCPGDGFEFEVELTAFFAQHNIKIEEVPIHYYPRTVSLGKKIGFKDFLLSAVTAFRCYFS
jgi:glycosyltransferase involved in cell wall biosynthesis